VDASQPARVHVAVDLRRRERRVSEKLLDRAEVYASLEEMRCVRVPEAMGVRQQAAEDARVEPLPPDGEEESVAGAACELRTAVAQPARDAPGRLLAERDEPLLVTLPTDVELLPVEVDVAEIEADGLGRPETARVDDLQQCGVAQRERAVV